MKLAFARAGLIALTVHALGSCGGGGGGGGGGSNPPPPPASTQIVIDNGNIQSVAELSFGPASTAYDTMQLLTSASLILHQSLLSPQSFFCETTGTVEMRAMDEDRNARLSKGDRVQVNYDACDNATGTVELRISNINLRDDAFTALDGSNTVDLEDSGARLTVDGDMKFRLNAKNLTWTGTNFRVAAGDGLQSEGMSRGRIEKTITNDTFTGLEYSLTFSGTAESDSLDGTFEFSTSEPFEGSEGAWPVSGTLVAEGRSNSRATFEPGRAQGLMNYRVGSGQVTEANWQDVFSGSIFGVDLDNGGNPPPPPPTAETLGRRLDLGGYPEDVVADNARSRIYVTVPERNELLVISAQTLAVLRRVIVGSEPAAMSLSLDGQELFIGLLGAGAIAVVDLDSFDQTQIVVAPTLQSSTVYDVVETSPGILFIASGDSSGSGVRLDRATGVQTAVAAMDRRSNLQIDLLADPVRNVLYVGDGWGVFPQNALKLDSSQFDAPQLATTEHGSVRGTHRMTLDPTGARLYLYGGQVLSTADFSVIATMDEPGGMVWASDNGQDVMVANSPGDLSVYSATTLSEIDQFDSDCALDPVWRLAPSPVDGQWVMLGPNALCVIDINHPETRPGSSDAGEPADPTPERNVAVVDMDVGGQIHDVEYDHSRNFAYLSLASTSELVTIDVASRQIVDRKSLSGVPHGIDLSPDESTLAVMFNDNGNIGFMDMASGVVDYRDLTAVLLNPHGGDVAYVSDDAVFAATDEYSGRVVRTSLLDATATRQVGGNSSTDDISRLLPSPDGAYLYVTNRSTKVTKLDLSKSSAPIVSMASQFAASEILGGDRIAISPDGERLVTGFGQVLRTGDYTRAGSIARGTPLYSYSGSEIFAASLEEPGRIDRVDAATFLTREVLHGNCSIAFPRRLIATATEDVLITTGESRACFWFLDAPPSSSMRIGPQSAYVCGASCLMRKFRRESPVDFRRVMPRQLH